MTTEWYSSAASEAINRILAKTEKRTQEPAGSNSPGGRASTLQTQVRKQRTAGNPGSGARSTTTLSAMKRPLFADHVFFLETPQHDSRFGGTMKHYHECVGRIYVSLPKTFWFCNFGLTVAQDQGGRTCTDPRKATHIIIFNSFAREGIDAGPSDYDVPSPEMAWTYRQLVTQFSQSEKMVLDYDWVIQCEAEQTRVDTKKFQIRYVEREMTKRTRLKLTLCLSLVQTSTPGQPAVPSPATQQVDSAVASSSQDRSVGGPNREPGVQEPLFDRPEAPDYPPPDVKPHFPLDTSHETQRRMKGLSLTPGPSQMTTTAVDKDIEQFLRSPERADTDHPTNDDSSLVIPNGPVDSEAQPGSTSKAASACGNLEMAGAGTSFFPHVSDESTNPLKRKTPHEGNHPLQEAPHARLLKGKSRVLEPDALSPLETTGKGKVIFQHRFGRPPMKFYFVIGSRLARINMLRRAVEVCQILNSVHDRLR